MLELHGDKSSRILIELPSMMMPLVTSIRFGEGTKSSIKEQTLDKMEWNIKVPNVGLVDHA